MVGCCITTRVIVGVVMITTCSTMLLGEKRNGIACIEELELPRFAVAKNLPSGGRVRSQVILGHNGQISELTTHGTARILEAEVEYHLRSRAKYSKECEGQRFELNFVFRVEGHQSHSPVIRTYFLPPNGFVIVTQPPKMTIDRITVEPKPD